MNLESDPGTIVTAPSPVPRRSRGFTLIELMITVAVIAILAGIAYPSYLGSVLKGKRAQGRAALLDLMQQEERYFTQNNSYLTFAAGSTSVPFKTFSGDSGLAGAAYKLQADVCSSTLTVRECVLLTAVPNGSDPAVGSLTLTSTGTKSCTGATPSLCWK